MSKKVICIDENDGTIIQKGKVYVVASEVLDHYVLEGVADIGFLKTRFEVVAESSDATPAETTAPAEVPAATTEPPFDFDAYNGTKGW